MAAFLEASGVTKRFGGLVALNRVNFELAEGRIASIIGPNGAGKTTFFNVFTGLYVPEEGSVTFRGRSLTGLRPDEITTLGVCRTFQNIRLFRNMTAVENVLVGMHARVDAGFWGAVSRNPHWKREEGRLWTRAAELLDVVGLRDRANEVARNLPYGDQRRLEIGRALASQPALLLLDEPTAGMTHGEIRALKGVTFHVGEGEVVALLGNNGAGKTTTLRAISGLLAPREGDVVFEGGSLVGVASHAIVRRGVTHVPEGRRIFNRLSVLENLEMGAFTRSDSGVRADIDRVFTIFTRLHERRTQVAGTLSGGEQQMLAIGRALMAKPRLLLLDEPSMGLAPVLVEQIFETVQTINRQGVTILLVEQNAAMALSVAGRGYVLETGGIVLEGSARDLADNPEVRRAYLGEA